MNTAEHTMRFKIETSMDDDAYTWLANERGARRFRYFALVGTWLTAIVVAWILSGCTPRHTTAIAIVPGFTPEEQALAAVHIERVCMGDPFRDSKDVHAALGSGVVIGPYDVLTAAHVINCPTGSVVLGVVGRDRVRRVADIIVIDYVHDLARLRVRTPYKGARSPGFAQPRDHELVSAYVSLPKSGEKLGRILRTGAMQVEWRIVDVESTIPAVAGNSGAPIYNQDGRLIALVTHSEDVLGLCRIDVAFCWSRGTSVLGKGILP